MVISNIESWLKTGRNFLSGVELYRTIIGDDSFSRLCAKGANAYTIDQLTIRLKKELEKATPQPSNPKKQLKTPKTNPTSKYTSIDYHDLPNELKMQADQLFDLWPRLNAKRHSLMFLDSDIKRRDVAHEIIEVLQPKIDAIYKELDHWKVYGKVMNKANESYISPVDQLKKWQKELKTIGEYISRNKNHKSSKIQLKVREKTDRREALKQLIST